MPITSRRAGAYTSRTRGVADAGTFTGVPATVAGTYISGTTTTHQSSGQYTQTFPRRNSSPDSP